MLVAYTDEAGTGEASGEIREEGGEVMGASGIKGITIEIGGDTTKLDKALSETGKKSKDLTRQLREVNNALKLDPGNTELVAQKQKLLADQIKNTKERLDVLKEAERQVQEQFERGEITEDQFRALQTEILTTEARLHSLNEEAANLKWAGVEEAGQKMQELGGKIEGAGKKLLPVTGIITTAGTAAGKMASDFEDAMAKVSTIADTTEMPIEDLEKAILDLSNQTGISSSEIASNVYDAISAGQKTGDAVSFVEKSTKLAKAGFADSGAALDILTTIMNAYGLEAQEVTRVSDVLISTQNLGKTTVADLASSMGKVIPTAKANGVSIENLSAMYAVMTANGIATAESTTYMNSMLNELGKQGTSAANAFAKGTEHIKEGGLTMKEAMEMGWDLTDVLSILDEEAYASGTSIANMFGSAEAGKAANVLWDNAEKLNEVVGEMGNSAGATDEAFAKLDTTSYKVQKAINEFKNTAIELGQQILEMAAPAIQAISDKVLNLATKFSGLSDDQKKLIIKIAAIVAAIGPLLVTGGKAVSLVGKLTSTFASLGAKLTAASANAAAAGTSLGAIAAPVAAVVAIVAALVAAFVHLWRTNEDFRNKILSIWNGIKEKFNSFAQGIVDRLNALGFDFENITDVIRALWDGLCKFLAPVFEGVFQQIANIFSFVLDVITGILDVFIGLFTGNWDQMLQGVKEIFGAAWEFVKNTFQNYANVLKNILNVVCEFFGTTWADAWEGIKQTFVNAWQAVKNGVSEVGSFIGGAFTTAYNAVISVFKGIGQWFADRWRDIMNALSTVATWFQTMFQNAYTNVTNIFKAIGQWFAARWQDIKNALSTVATWFQTMFQNAYTNVTNIFKAIGQWFAARWQDIKNALSTVATWFQTMFQNAYTNLTNVFKGIGQWFSARYTDIKNAISGIPEFFRSTFQSAFDKITGVFKGIGSWFKTNVIDAIKGVFDNFDFGQIGRNIINAIKNGIKSISIPKLSIEWGTSEKTIAGVTIKVPVPHISWNAAGGIMQNPTIFGMYGGKLQGGGEAGPEAILPLDTFYERVEGYINEAAERAAQAAADSGSRAAGGRGGDFYQYNSYTSPKALSPSEAARQTRNATRNMVLQLQRGRG